MIGSPESPALSQLLTAKSSSLNTDPNRSSDLAILDGRISPDLSTQAIPQTPDTVKVQLSRIQFAFVFAGLLLAMMMAALDQTIVSSSLKAIIGDLGHQELVPWIGSSYLMTAAPFGTLFGRFADIFGRKWIFVAALAFFQLGSLLCAVAPSMNFLIFARAVAGVGGGGILSSVPIILADIVLLQDRGKYQGMLAAMYSLALTLGPLVGGGFSDYVSWRWCFYINLPIGFAAIFAVIVCFKQTMLESSLMEKIKRIDFFGTAALFAAILCVITPLQLGGSTWAWSSPQVIVLFAIAPFMITLFVYIELKIAKEPIIPAALFSNTSVPALLLISFCVGSSCFPVVYYQPLFFQITSGDTATQAAVQMIPLTAGVVFFNITSGILISKTGNYRNFFIIGPLFMFIGFPLASTLTGASSTAQKVIYLILLGVGAGMTMHTRIVAIQASVAPHLIAIATAASQTSLHIGGAFSVAISGTIINNVVANDIGSSPVLARAISDMQDRGFAVDVTEVSALVALLRSLPFLENGAAAADALVNMFNDAYKTAYLYMLVYAALILVASIFVVQMKMGGKSGNTEA